MEVSVSGFKCVGSWNEIVEHGDRITNHLMQHEDVDQEALAEWNQWRPNKHEDFSDDIREKTAEQTSVDEGPGEEQDTSATEDAKEAGKKLANSPKKAVDETLSEAGKDVKESAQHAARAVDSAGRKTMRAVEKTVYERVMTQMSPCYFDNQLVSANLGQQRQVAPIGGGDTESEDQFVFEININDDAIKQDVEDELSEADGVELN